MDLKQGENVSPLLFSLFVDDFDSYISNHYRGFGVARLHNIEFMNLFSLHYANDTIVLAESDSEMQLALSARASYCKKNKLKVNPSKWGKGEG